MRRPDRREERGAASIFVIGMSIVLLACAGLVIDGGLAINARMAVADDAEQAARIGADSIDVSVLRGGGGITIDPSLARQRAAGYLSSRGYGPGQADISVDAADGTVSVVVRDTTTTTILGLVGFGQFDVSAQATSAPETGS